MKKLTIIIIALLFFACTEKEKGVKVIENYDQEYLTEEQVDSEPGTEGELEVLSLDLEKIVSDAAEEYTLPAKAYLNFRIYLNEKGKVDGIKSLPIPNEYLFSNSEKKIIDSKGLTGKIAVAAEKWDFNPALKDGMPVKFRGDIELIMNVDENGNITQEIPSLKSMGKALAKIKFKDDDKYFVAVEEQPSPIGGLDALQKKITYPDKAKMEGIQGRVFVKAYINENGEVDNVVLLKGIDPECDSVAMEAVRQTKFTPGKQRGEPVKVQVSIPIIFKLR